MTKKILLWIEAGTRTGGKTHLPCTHSTHYCLCSECKRLVNALTIKQHLDVAFHILSYLKGTVGKGLIFQKSEKRRKPGFVNADWTISITRSRFTSRYCSKYWDNFGYMEKKQSIVAISEDMEFQTIAEGICEFIWLKILIKDLQLPSLNQMKQVKIDRNFIES